MALKVTLFDHHFIYLPYIYLFYGIYNCILLFPVSLVTVIIIIIIITISVALLSYVQGQQYCVKLSTLAQEQTFLVAMVLTWYYLW